MVFIMASWACKIPLSSRRQIHPSRIGNHFTLAILLKSKGYATAQAGKWQLSGKLPTLVRDAGFEEYCMWAYDHNLPEGVTHPSHEKGGNTSRYWHPSLIKNGEYLADQARRLWPRYLESVCARDLRGDIR